MAFKNCEESKTGSYQNGAPYLRLRRVIIKKEDGFIKILLLLNICHNKLDIM